MCKGLTCPLTRVCLRLFFYIKAVLDVFVSVCSLCVSVVCVCVRERERERDEEGERET